MQSKIGVPNFVLVTNKKKLKNGLHILILLKPNLLSQEDSNILYFSPNHPYFGNCSLIDKYLEIF